MSQAGARTDPAGNAAAPDEAAAPGSAVDPGPADGLPRRRWFAWTTRQRTLAPVVAVVWLFYVGTAATSGARLALGKQKDYYNQLTSALIRGHLNLLTKVPAGLASLKDPYDPRLHSHYDKFFDLVYYHGRFYLTWGPTPVLTLLMPWRLLHIGGMPLAVALVIYCCLGFLFAVALLCYLVDRYLPDTKPWQLALATLALGLSNVAPFLLRRPAVYEVAVASAYCFATLGAYLVATGGLGSRLRPWRLAAGSLSVGLAVGGRPPLLFEGLLLVALYVYLARRDRARTRQERLRLGGLLFGPFAVVVLLLLAYNYARFGSFLDYGISHTLAAGDFTKLPSPSLSYVAPGLYSYVINPVRWTLAFPYFTLAPPPGYPGSTPSYYYTELTGGLLATTPIVLVLLPGCVHLWRRRDRELGALVGLFVLAGALIVLLLSASFWFTTMRYEADFATFLLLAALLAWFALARVRARRVAAVLGALAILYGCTIGVATSVYGYYDSLRRSHPGIYWTFDRFTSPLPTLATMVIGHPVIVRLIDPALHRMGNYGTYHTGSTPFRLSGREVELDVVSPRSGRWHLAPTFARRLVFAGRGVSVIVRYADGTTQRVSLGAGVQGFELSLHRGLNRIFLAATASGVGERVPLVNVLGVRLLR